MSLSDFQFKSFKVVNPQKGLKVTTDACLLGALAQHTNPQKIIDIGCGSAVIALMLAQKFPNTDIAAIDIDEDVIENSRFNIGQSGFQNDFNIINADFLELEFENKFDLLVCNPPYFKDHLQNPQSNNYLAVHNHTMGFEHLIDKTKSLMNPESLFWIILPPYEMSVFINKAVDKQLFVNQSISIFNKPGKHFREIVCLSIVHPEIEVKKSLLMFDINNEMSEEFKQLMFPFYLDK